MPDTPVNEILRREYEKALLDGEQPALESFLPAFDDEEYLGTLVELVLIEIESRWHAAPASNFDEAHELLPEYLTRFPALLRADLDELRVEERAMRGAALRKASVPPCSAPPGVSGPQRLGEYRILREIGRGGMGVVYEAEQVALGRHVALKVLPAEALANPQLITRFQREARAAAQLHHTNIVPVFGVGEADGQYFYAMQYIEGTGLDGLVCELIRLGEFSSAPSNGPIAAIRERNSSSTPGLIPSVGRSILQGELAETIVPGLVEETADRPLKHAAATPSTQPQAPDKTGTFDQTDVARSPSSFLLGEESDSRVSSRRRTRWHTLARVGIQAADGLDYAHKRGILHRDIKPANLILDQKGIVWITDFGLARIESEENITRTGDLMGTLRYMPPEALEGGSDNRSDIFSLGLTLYELLGLRPGYNESDRNRLIQRIMNAEVVPLHEIQPSVPRDLVTIVHKCLDREPSARYQTAGALRDDLERFIQDEPIKARRVTLVERLVRWTRRNKAIAASLATIMLLLISVAIASSLAAEKFSELADDKSELAEQRETQRLAAVAATQHAEEKQAEAEAQERAANIARVEAQELAERNRRQLYTSQMLVAADALRIETGIGRVRQILDTWIPNPGEQDLRGWEWYYLTGLCHEEEASLPEHVNQVRGLTWSLSGDSVLAAHNGSRFSEYASDGSSLRHGVEVPGAAQGAAWSHDRTRLAASGYDGTLRIFAWPDGRELVNLRLHERYSRLKWSSDGRWIACGCHLHPHVLVLHAADGQEALRLDVANNDPPFAFHPSQSRLAFGDNSTTRVVDIPGGAEGTAFENPGARMTTEIDWSPDGTRLVECSEGSVRIRNVESGEVLHAAHVNGIHYDSDWHDSGGVAVASRNGTVSILDPTTGTITRVFRGHRNWAEWVAWSPDGQRLASGGPSDPPTIWNPTRSPNEVSIPGYYWTGSSWSPDSRNLAVAVEHTIHIWDMDDRREISMRRLGVPVDQRVITVAYSPDGRSLAYIQDRGRVAVLDPANGKVIRVLQETTDGTLLASQSTELLSWSGDSRRLAAVLPTGQVILWDVETGETLANQKPCNGASLLSATLHPEGSRIALGTSNGVQLWAADAKEVRALSDSWSPGVAWSPNRLTVIGTGGYDDLFSVAEIDFTQNDPPVIYRGATRWANAFGLNPDGTRLAAGCDDGSVCVWDTESRAMVARFDDFDRRCIDVSWSPDGSQLTATTYSKIVVRDARLGVKLAGSWKPAGIAAQPPRSDEAGGDQ